MLTILVDTREQLPYSWADCVSRTATLKTGDYSLPGHEDRVCIERKRLPELWAITGAQRERFERELTRMLDFEYCAIVIEAEMREVLVGDPRTKVPPRAVINSLASWSVQYNVAVWWAGTRSNGAALTRSLLRRFAKYRGVRI